jgi:hypothetical protein
LSLFADGVNTAYSGKEAVMKKYVVDLASSESKLLTDAIPAWGKSRNEVNAKILWRFTTDDA